MSHSISQCKSEQNFIESQFVSNTISKHSVIEQTRTCPTCERKYVFVYTYSGIWDPDEQEYIADSLLEFDYTNLLFEGEKVIVPTTESGLSYQERYILSERIDPDGKTHTV